MDKIVIARKQHTCTYCGKVILKGEKYHYAEWKDPLFAQDVMGNDVQISIDFRRDRICLKCDKKTYATVKEV